jgi:hypothetical protein
MLPSKFYDDSSTCFFLYAQELSMDLRLAKELLTFFLPLDLVQIVITIKLGLIQKIGIVFLRRYLIFGRSSFRYCRQQSFESALKLFAFQVRNKYPHER